MFEYTDAWRALERGERVYAMDVTRTAEARLDVQVSRGKLTADYGSWSGEKYWVLHV